MVLDDEDGLATLAILARTARCLQEVALNRLWDYQTSLVPLVKCFPAHLWAEKPGDDGVRTVKLLGEPKTEDWARVKFYASRIRTLSLNPPVGADTRWEGRLAGDVFITLRKALGSDPFLPNLDSFGWAQSSARWTEETHELAAFLLMLNPLVSSMDVVMAEWSKKSERAIVSALKAYGHDGSQLRSLKFKCSESPLIERAVLDLAKRQHHLLSLRYAWETAMPLNTIVHFSAMHQLREISIRADQKTTLKLSEDAIAGSRSFFPSLHLLSVHADTLALCERWLRMVQSPALDGISFVVDQPPAAPALQAFFASLVRDDRMRSKLRSLRFASTNPRTRGEAGQVVTSGTLEPLLRLSLTALQLEPGMPIDIDDAFVERMANAWPSIRTLELGAEWRREGLFSRVTIQGLIPLALRCEDLTKLALTFNTDTSAFDGRYDIGLRPLNGVSFDPWNHFVLGVGASMVYHQTNIAMLSSVLSDLCPGLRALQTAWDRAEGRGTDSGEWDSQEDEVETAWYQIGRYTKEMARIRRQERLWID
ncbi:hypothetical protein C8Q70DRAFT_919833 [Cubamyces menziesii]|nr:hypothetical protein C8Q70DRAFT_919833 [Cubamyces menziesii]